METKQFTQEEQLLLKRKTEVLDFLTKYFNLLPVMNGKYTTTISDVVRIVKPVFIDLVNGSPKEEFSLTLHKDSNLLSFLVVVMDTIKERFSFLSIKEERIDKTDAVVEISYTVSFTDEVEDDSIKE
ncbi:MAG: hypothetical protein M0R77_00300 [Gammaproteobacteria bacterium]|nr:hypothetical protein [Acholeplasmataceae bacterium]MCK9528995.1 hypothetical protein [Gammaproteobacteria bacterium]